jgi:hypothetical protein
MIYYCTVVEVDGSSEVRIPDLGLSKTVEGQVAKVRTLGIILEEIQRLMDMRRPVPSPVRGRADVAGAVPPSKVLAVEVPVLLAVKIRIYQKWLASNVGLAAFAKKAGVSTTAVRSLFDLKTPTGINILTAAARATGHRLVFSLEEL